MNFLANIASNLGGLFTTATTKAGEFLGILPKTAEAPGSEFQVGESPYVYKRYN